MRMTLDEFERKFFEPARITDFIENRASWIEQYKATDDETRWTTYFMLIGGLAAGGRITPEEFQQEGPNKYSAKDVPTPERLYALTALTSLLR